MTEFILATALVAVIAMLFLPAFAKMRRGVDETKCLANLRQIGVAATTYMGERQGKLFPDKFFYMPLALGNYLGLPEKTNRDTVFTCPALKRLEGEFPDSNWHHRTYSLNAYVVPASSLKPRRLQEIEHPGEMILIADGVAVRPGFSNTITPAQARDTNSTLYPHRRLNHVLFVDGHVRGLDLVTMSQNGNLPIWGKLP